MKKVSDKAKGNIWYAVERFGLPTVLCGCLWFGFRADASNAREDAKEFSQQVLENTANVTKAIVANTEVSRQQVTQQRALELVVDRQTQAIDRQTDVFEHLCDRLEGQ